MRFIGLKSVEKMEKLTPLFATYTRLVSSWPILARADHLSVEERFVAETE